MPFPRPFRRRLDHYAAGVAFASRMGLDVDIAAAENLLTALFNEEIGFVAQVDTARLQSDLQVSAVPMYTHSAPPRR